MKGNLKKVAITVGLSAVILLGASIPVVKMINNHKQQLAIEAAAQEKKRKEEEEAKKPIIGVNKEGQKYTYDAKKVQEKLSKYDYSNNGKKIVFLTFDDGTSKTNTPEILRILDENNVKATFFLIGENAENTPELVKRESEEGHLVGNHTYHHVEITRVPDETAKEEILMTNEVITGITGEEVSYMRPPFGAWQKKLEWELDVMPVMWTIDPLDWTTNNEDEIVNKVVTQAKENDIILLHDCYESSVNAALRIVDILQKEGFEFVTIDELIMN